MERRGVSGVVTSVLIIVIAIAAVTILWAALRPVIEDSAEGVSADCITLDVRAVSCEVAVDGSADVVVRRNSGAGELSSVKVILEDGDGNRDVVDNSTAFSELESKTIEVSADDITVTPTNAYVAAVSGDEVCAESEPVACTTA